MFRPLLTFFLCGGGVCVVRVDSLVLLGEGMSASKTGGLGRRLAVELEGQQQRKGEVVRAIAGVVVLLPRLRSSFAATFVHGLVNRLVLNLTPATAEPAMAALKLLIVTAPEGVSALVRYVHTWPLVGWLMIDFLSRAEK